VTTDGSLADVHDAIDDGETRSIRDVSSDSAGSGSSDARENDGNDGGDGSPDSTDTDVPEDATTDSNANGSLDGTTSAPDGTTDVGGERDTSTGGGTTSDTSTGGGNTSDASTGDGTTRDATSGGGKPRDTSGVDSSDGGAGATDVSDGGLDGSTAPTDTSTRGGDARDGSTSLDTGATLTCSGNLTPCNGSCVDTYTNRNHCGTCSVSCSGQERCINGSCECPRYQKRCGGSCVPINTDPDHCGGCGTICSSQEVCSAGKCVNDDGCLPGLSQCGRTCVDTDSDEQNCGGCGSTCPTGKGCVDGSCVQQVSLKNASPSKCIGGGPPIEVGFTSNEEQCLGNVAKRTFRWALCSCSSLTFGNKLVTDAFDSTVAPYQKGGFGGGLGSNGYVELGNDTDIDGAVWTASSRGLKATNKLDVSQELHSGGRVVFENKTTLRGDAYVEGDVAGQGTVRFQSTLHLDRNASITGPNIRYNTLKRRDVDVPTVCKRCKSSNRIPVGGIVRRHDDGNNDNGVVGLNPDALKRPGGKRSLRLPCGEYYLSEIDTQNKISIVVTGQTALYIGGDLVARNDITIRPTPSAELDLFVAGNVRLANKANVGAASHPASTRVYVGGSTGMTFGNDALLGGFFYVDPGRLKAKNKMELFGGMYARRIRAKNDVRVHYDRAVLKAGQQCPTPRPGSGNSGGDVGVDGGTSGVDGGLSDAGTVDTGGVSDTGTTDTSGGGGSTCSDEGRTCSVDSDCCAPLVCDNGECAVTSCTPLDYKCASDSECCSERCEPTGNGYSLCISSF
jgi:hypothetical protein